MNVTLTADTALRHRQSPSLKWVKVEIQMSHALIQYMITHRQIMCICLIVDLGGEILTAHTIGLSFHCSLPIFVINIARLGSKV